jgi:hypothetical protein
MAKAKSTTKTAPAPVARKFRQSARYTDSAKNTLSVSVRQIAPESYRVSVAHRTAANGKRQSGMVTSHPTQSAAVAKFNAISKMAEKNKWVISVKQRREAFTVLPVAV